MRNKIKKTITEIKPYKMVTNGNLAIRLLNCDLSELEIYDISKPYKVGRFENVLLFVDPYMKWSDNRVIYFDENDKEIKE